jgi:hypothetical protein
MHIFDAIVTRRHLFSAVEISHVGISFRGKGSRDWDDCGRWIYDVHAQKKEDMAFFMDQHCNERDLDLIDFDGPFRLLYLFGWSRRRGKPKWADERPENIPADEWKKRLKSHGEREAYWAGLEAGRNERIKG